MKQRDLFRKILCLDKQWGVLHTLLTRCLSYALLNNFTKLIALNNEYDDFGSLSTWTDLKKKSLMNLFFNQHLCHRNLLYCSIYNIVWHSPKIIAIFVNVSRIGTVFSTNINRQWGQISISYSSQAKRFSQVIKISKMQSRTKT